MSSTVEDWLRSLGLIQYTQEFLDNGYDELDICKEIGEEDLDAIGVENIRDRVDILSAVERLKQSGTAVYFVLEEGQDSLPPPNAQTREKFIPLKLKMLLDDKLQEDKIRLTDYPYTERDGSCGNLAALVTLYADKFYTYEEDVQEALESMRLRQVGEMAKKQDDAKQETPKAGTLPKAFRKNSPANTSGVRRRESSSSSYTSDTASSECHSAPPFADSKVPAEYLDVSSPTKPDKEKRRRPVERNTKLSRSLDSLKELHVNADIKGLKPRAREPSSFKGKPFSSWFRSSKRSSKSSSHEDKIPESKPCSPGDLPASDITMGEEDRMTLMIMVKQGDLTVEEAVEQLQQYEKEHRPKPPSQPQQKSGSCSEDDSPAAKTKIKRGFFPSMKKRHTGRPVSEIVACDMKMSEQDRIELMKSVRDHKITVEQALERLVSYEEKHKDDEGSPSHKSKNVRHKFSPKSSRNSTSRISIKRVSGAFASVINTAPPKAQPSFVSYAEQDSGLVVSSEDDAMPQSDSSPDPSPGGNRRLRQVQNESFSSLHSSSSSSVGKSGDDPPCQLSASAPAHKLHGLLNEINTVLMAREEGVEKVSTLPRREKPAPLDRKGSLPEFTPKKAMAPMAPPKVARRPPPPPRKPSTPPTVRKATPPPLTPPNQTSKIEQSSTPGAAATGVPLPLPPNKTNDIQSRTVSPEGGCMSDEDRFPSPPPADMLLQEDTDMGPVNQKSIEDARARLKTRPPLGKEIPAKPPRRKKECGPLPITQDTSVTPSVIQEPNRSPTSPPPLPPRPETAIFNQTSVIVRRPQIYNNANLGINDTASSDSKGSDCSAEKKVIKETESGVKDSETVAKPKPPVKTKPKPPPKKSKPPPSIANKPSTGGVGRDDNKPAEALQVPVPKKRASHSLSELIERRLRIEQINLAERPYTEKNGRWGVPVNLVDRYSEELRRPKEEIAQIMDKIRSLKLKEQRRQMVPCDFSSQLSGADPVGNLSSLEDWLVSLGLPMYIDNMKEVEYDDMMHVPFLQQKHFEYAGVVDPRHMRRLLNSVERMPR
ncbi:SAM and SH3 domain-containing protein 1 [Nematostella vectensis]|uniref:SAM and SH3 domain-containing protein 1 n=1 Tax=Nematostella vectensis TaxID=45351 RepID=UPI0020774244|nr:SAM and SH3 domain-containing protein 1 [Nematostella vectensis]